jgi:hypothetical protein
MAKKPPPDPHTHLRLEDLSDIAVLEAFEASFNGDASCTTQDVVAQLELNVETPNRFVGARLGWLKRLGVIDREDGKWFFTNEGWDVFESRRLNARQAEQLERLGERGPAAVSEWLANAMMTASGTRYGVLRRQVRHAELRRKAGFSR